MKKNYIYFDNLLERRNFFQQNFPMIKIGRQRVDVNSSDILKNTCPCCGYMTLDERDTFDDCGICFWEDDGIDDYESNEESGPNYMTLTEGRKIFRDAKERLLNSNMVENKLIISLKDTFINLDNLIEEKLTNLREIKVLQDKIIELLDKNTIHGLGKLFEK